MAVNTNEIRIVTTQAERALANLQGSLGKLNDAFGGLKTAIAGLAIGSFITQAYKMADALSDLSDATGISIAAIKGFQDAIKASGGDAEGATTGIGKFTLAIDAAASGSKELQDKFLKLGFSLKELGSLSEEALLEQVVLRLGAMGPSAERSAIGVALFGKAFREIDFEKAAGGLLDYTEKADGSAASIKAAGDASDAMAQAMSKLQTAVVITLKPFSDFIVALSENQGQLDGLIKLIINLTGVIVGLFVVQKIVAAFQLFTTVIGGFAAAVKVATVSVGGFAAVFSRLLGIVGLVVTAFTLIDSAIQALTGKDIADWAEEAAKAIGLINETSSETQAMTDEEYNRQEAIKRTANAARDAGREFQAALQKEIDALTKVTSAYQRANEQANKKFAIDTQALGLSTAQRLEREQLAEAETRYYNEMAKLDDELAAKRKSNSESDRNMIPEIQSAQAKLTEEYNKQRSAVIELTGARTSALEAQQLELYQTKQNINFQNQLQKIQDDIAKSTMSEIERKYYDIEAAARDSAKAAIEAEAARRNISVDQMDVASINAYYEAAYRGSEKLKAALKIQYEQSRTFSAGWKKAFQEYADNATNAAKNAERIFDKLMGGLEDMLVDFVKTGKFEWKKFAASMLEELLRMQLRQAFSGILGGITDLFGDSGEMAGGRGATPNNPVYVADITGGGGAGGAFGGGAGGMGDYSGGGYGMGSLATGRGDPFGGVFGAAGALPYQTESAPANWYANTQAENFYEPWKNASGWLGENASLPYQTESAPTDWFANTQADNFYEPWKNNSSWLDSLTSGWSSPEPALDWSSSIPTTSYGSGEDLFSGIGDWFDGWFANGGNISPGKWGIVGEKGPELVQGPATVTPMDNMGGTNVTYNINAVDAASFKAMIAADPSFIHAVAMQGASSIPRR